MLAGYLPFDDDPANPEGDNINLLYKYIVSTPLTFPEYVTPHARDLLRRILVPDPRKRADLFEVARHSWLSDYAHVVSHVTSSTTTVGEIANTTVTAGMFTSFLEYSSFRNSCTNRQYHLFVAHHNRPSVLINVIADQQDAPLLARSASVREPSKVNPANISPVGGLSHQGKIDPEVPNEKTKAARDPKRRTVQVEYVAPQSQTTRGEVSPPTVSPAAVAVAPVSGASSSKTRARGTIEDPNVSPWQPSAVATSSKLLPQESSTTESVRQERAQYSQQDVAKSQQRPGPSQQPMAPPTRPPKDLPRSVSDSTSAFAPFSASTTGRPATSGSMASGAGRLPSRGNSYSQPLAPTVAATNAQARLSQPSKNGKQYHISNPIPQPEPYYSEQSIGRPATQQYTPAATPPQQRDQPRSHKRSNTLGNLLGRSGSVFGGRSQSQQSQEQKPLQEQRYPPTSMKNPIASDSPRQSTDSRRPSFSFGRKNSDYRKNSDVPKQEKPRRFSLLPASFSFKNLTPGSKDQSSTGPIPVSERRPSTMQKMSQSREQSRPQTTADSRGQGRSNSYRDDDFQSTGYDGHTDRQRDGGAQQARRNNGSSRSGPRSEQRPYGDPPYSSQQEPLSPLRPPQGQSYLLGGSGTPTDSEISLTAGQHRPIYPAGFDSYDSESRPSMQKPRGTRGPAVLTKNRKFTDAYEQDQEPGQGAGGSHAGSSGAARRVMDFFRRRGKARAGEDRV